jgi:hypothetical protein
MVEPENELTLIFKILYRLYNEILIEKYSK